MENSWYNCKLQVSSRKWVLLFLRFKLKEQPWSNILLFSLQREGAREEDNHKVKVAVYMLGWSVCCVHSFHWSKAYHRAEPNMNGLGWEYIIHDRERRVKICIHQFNVPQSAAKRPQPRARSSQQESHVELRVLKPEHDKIEYTFTFIFIISFYRDQTLCHIIRTALWNTARRF